MDTPISDKAVTAEEASKLMNEAVDAAPHRFYGPIALLMQDRLMNAQRVADMAALAGEIREGGTAERQIREGVALAKAVMATPSPAALPYLDTTRPEIAAELDSFAKAFTEGRDALAAQGCANEAAVLGGAAKALAVRAASLRGRQ